MLSSKNELTKAKSTSIRVAVEMLAELASRAEDINEGLRANFLAVTTLNEQPKQVASTRAVETATGSELARQLFDIAERLSREFGRMREFIDASDV